MKTLKLKKLLIVIMVAGLPVMAQTQKLSKTFKINNAVDLKIDTKRTNIIIENWDRNEVQVEAVLEDTNLSSEDKKKQLDNWKLETSQNGNYIRINSGSDYGENLNIDMATMGKSMEKFNDMLGPLMEGLKPMIESIASNPPLPPDFYEKMGNMNFDYEAYKKDGDKYMKKFEAKMEKNFGKDFEKSMEKWAEQFEKNSEVWEKDFAVKMEAWGESFGKDMEEWGENFGSQMEEWGNNFEKNMEGKSDEQKMNMMKSIENNEKSSKSIHIKVPKNTSLNLNVRYGQVILGNVNNLRANLSHSDLNVGTVSGDQTNVKVSYTPVRIAQWNYGILNASYVEECIINKVKSIKLISNSSDVEIKQIDETGILSGSFGSLEINKLDPNFKNLDISLENSDLKLSLPQSALNFNYNGTQSTVKYPKASTVKSSSSYDNEILNGYYKSKDAAGSISIKASYSDVLIK